ncbi:hypothetical protein DFH09DRAFT_1284684 [Mycena vulgaris]|nr:hypothetical protein DFH09DRAFT_1284684 [Mycena vulgaris]
MLRIGNHRPGNPCFSPTLTNRAANGVFNLRSPPSYEPHPSESEIDEIEAFLVEPVQKKTRLKNDWMTRFLDSVLSLTTLRAKSDSFANRIEVQIWRLSSGAMETRLVMINAESDRNSVFLIAESFWLRFSLVFNRPSAFSQHAVAWYFTEVTRQARQFRTNFELISNSGFRRVVGPSHNSTSTMFCNGSSICSVTRGHWPWPWFYGWIERKTRREGAIETAIGDIKSDDPDSWSIGDGVAWILSLARSPDRGKSRGVLRTGVLTYGRDQNLGGDPNRVGD